MAFLLSLEQRLQTHDAWANGVLSYMRYTYIKYIRDLSGKSPTSVNRKRMVYIKLT